ncbi:MAG: hypothetical protein ACREWG_06505 [Gammaproteobacteria bacterium]
MSTRPVPAAFWTRSTDYGVVHTPPRGNSDSGSNLLLVFAHGIFGDSRRTWGRMPEWVLERAGVDVTVASYAYPSRLLDRTSVRQAADDLKTWLETDFADHRHLVFFTHSTGGLVVKQMLRRSYAALGAALEKGELDRMALGSVWWRARRVVNIAVPHSGGARLQTYTSGFVYRYVFYPLVAPLLRAVRFVTQGGKDWGRNEIITALRWRNPWLLALESEFLAQIAAAGRHGLPAPIVHDIFAKSDLSVPLRAVEGEREIYFRGTHGSVKVPKQPDAPVITVAAAFVTRYGTDPVLDLADKTLERIAEVNRATQTRELIGADPSTPQDQPVPASVASAMPGTQQDICDLVVRKLAGESELPRRLVVTGIAGVGKSTVTRMIAWRLARDYLAGPGASTPFPLLIPMQQITLSEPVGEQFWDRLLTWWSDWTHSLYPNRTLDPRVLHEAFARRASVVILDGLDDFLVNHPTIGFSFLVDALRGVTSRYGRNGRFAILAAVRSGLHGIERLVTAPKDLYEVLRLSATQAQQAFPACTGWLPRIRDPALLELVSTPLVLSSFEPDAETLSDGRFLTPAYVLEQTLRTLLRRSQLTDLRRDGGAHLEIDELLGALTLIAWVFFVKHRGEMDIGVMRQEVETVRARWEGYFAAKAQSQEGREPVSGFRLLEDGATCNAIMQRSVFIATGASRIRFAHRSWQELLLARYFVLCLKWGYVEDFGSTAFNSTIYRMAGQCFRGETLTEERVEAVLEAWRKTGNTYITGNVIAFLAWTQTAIEPRAIQLILEALPRFEALSRIVLIAGWGYRVLADVPGDASVVDLRRALLPVLRALSGSVREPHDPVAVSLAWCYQKAFAALFGTPAPESPWPAIGFSDEETRAALPMICTLQDGKTLLDTRSRSLQLAFLVPILDAYHDPKLAIRALHYLYYLVVARKHGVHVFELSQELPQLLEPGCRLERIIESFTWVPELLDLYRACQTVHRQLESAVI